MTVSFPNSVAETQLSSCPYLFDKVCHDCPALEPSSSFGGYSVFQCIGKGILCFYFIFFYKHVFSQNFQVNSDYAYDFFSSIFLFIIALISSGSALFKNNIFILLLYLLYFIVRRIFRDKKIFISITFNNFR